MDYYINCIKQSNSLSKDIKELIPEMNIRRRMSSIVKMAVSTGIETILDFEPWGKVDAIITATSLGCIAESEKFLHNIIDSNENMLNPTPFINSTFNTVGAQIALIKSLHCYNNTFTHRYTSFESALIEGRLRLSSGMSKAVLIGVFDEATPTVEAIMKRMGILKYKKLGEGAVFFVMTNEKLSTSIAKIEEISFGVSDKEALSLEKESSSLWSGALAELIAMSIDRHYNGYIINDINGKNNSLIKLVCL